MSSISSQSWSDDPDAPLAAGAGRARGALFKRLIDLFGAISGLIVLFPILVLVCGMIALETRGPILFRQRRTGFQGRAFSIFKFRTMRVLEDGATIVQASRGDDRITDVGRFLRRSSIDELPQLINVVLGEMSLVGPRPHALAHDEYYAAAISSYNQRFLVKPGLTGLAQVCGLRGETAELYEMEARVEKDLEYIREWSLWLDIKILARTLLIFAFHPAAY